MKLRKLLFFAALLLGAIPAYAQASETTDWAEHKFVPQDTEQQCVWMNNNLYCPRNRVPIVVQSRRVMDESTIQELQRLQRANRLDLTPNN